MRISDWSSDVCSSDLFAGILNSLGSEVTLLNRTHTILRSYDAELTAKLVDIYRARGIKLLFSTSLVGAERDVNGRIAMELRSEEHTSELQSLMRISYAVFCLKKKSHTFAKRREIKNEIGLQYCCIVSRNDNV